MIGSRGKLAHLPWEVLHDGTTFDPGHDPCGAGALGGGSGKAPAFTGAIAERISWQLGVMAELQALDFEQEEAKILKITTIFR